MRRVLTFQKGQWVVLFLILITPLIKSQSIYTKDLYTAIIIRVSIEIILTWIILQGIYRFCRWIKKKIHIRKEKQANDMARRIAIRLNEINNRAERKK